MPKLYPSIRSLRLLAGEGNFNCYKTLKAGSRIFLFSKYFFTTLSYTKSKGHIATSKSVAFIKGSNQLRYHKYAKEQLSIELGEIQDFANFYFKNSHKMNVLPRFSISSATLQTFYLILMLFTGKKRYLNLYLLIFSSEMNKVVKLGFKEVNDFICYNDQPYDLAAITDALNRKKNKCRTIVIQHGLIINENFYFPSNAQEFWAWGNLSKQFYYARNKSSQIIVKGRYNKDSSTKINTFLDMNQKKTINILIAPSFHHNEVKQLCSSLSHSAFASSQKKIKLSIKYHPATKFITLLKKWNIQKSYKIIEEAKPMEMLSEKYDILITKNSTSSIDFLLRGKPVFFLSPHENNLFPSISYGFDIKELEDYIYSLQKVPNSKNEARLNFLEDSLNV